MCLTLSVPAPPRLRILLSRGVRSFLPPLVPADMLVSIPPLRVKLLPGSLFLHGFFLLWRWRWWVPRSERPGLRRGCAAAAGVEAETAAEQAEVAKAVVIVSSFVPVGG